MNCNGSFSAIIGVALVVLIASIGFTYYSSGVSQKALLEQQDALEVRQHWTNVRFLLDKAAAEALHDVAASCRTDKDIYKTKLDNSTNGYFVKVLSSTNGSLICEFSNLVVSEQGNSEKFAIRFSFRCEKTGSVSYSGNVEFRKELRENGSACEVWDTQGSPEFREIP